MTQALVQTAHNPVTITTDGSNPVSFIFADPMFGGEPGPAATNRAVIQTMLDSGGHIAFLGANTYEIDQALEINSDTLLDLGNCTIKQADSSDDNLMRTSAYNATKTSVSSLVWATGTCTATTSTAHGLSPGDFVSIIGATIAGYGGVHEVLTAIDTTHFTYAVPDIGTTPSTGTITCVKANENIVITGGTWDYNEANQTTAGTTEAFGHFLCHVNNLRVQNLNYLSCEKFCFFPFSLNDFIFENIYFNTVSDCIHIDGPAKNGMIKNVGGIAGDDAIVLMSKEDAAFAYAALSDGDIFGVTIDSARFTTTTSVVALFTPGDTAYIYDGILVKSVSGKTDSSAIKIASPTASSNYAQSIVIDGVDAVPTGDQPVVVMNSDVEIRNLVIRNIVHRRPTWKNSAIQLQAGIIDSLIVDNLMLPNGWNSDGSAAAWGVSTATGTTISQLILQNTSVNIGVSSRKISLVECGHTGDSIKIINCNQTGGLRMLYVNTNAAINTVMMKNITTDNVVEGLRLVDNNVDVIVDGWVVTDTSAARFGIKMDGGTETINLHLNGFIASGTVSLIDRTTGVEPTVNIYAPSFTWDVADFASATAGQQCIHDGTVRGTMVAGSCGNTGGTWYNFSDPLNDIWTP